jgi:tetratricopeptide (TPR) repeat protein
MPAGIKIIRGRAAILVAGAAIVLAGIAAYRDSFSGVMLYDDIPSIVENSTIRRLWPMGDILVTPGSGTLTVSGRPMLNLSFAVNYAISGTNVWSYHALNLLIHLSAALALFGIVRRTLQHLRTDEETATLLAFAVALLWTVHPLQTEAVTYIVQRAESLMGLFYLLTLYCFIRYAEEGGDGRPARPGQAGNTSTIWLGLSVLSCLLGMATKEVMATAPVLVLLYDRTFVAGTFAKAWRLRWKAYAALAATWLPLACFVASTGGNRGGSVGIGVEATAWAYWLTQFGAVARYLRLSIWPHPLVFEYGLLTVRGAGEVVPYAIPVLVLLAGTIWALTRGEKEGNSGTRAAGFLGAWFFGILAPSSLMPGTSQMIVEHRMYLSLAAVIAFIVLGIHAAIGRARALVCICLVLALGLGAMTNRRNETYHSSLGLWRDTLAKRPENLVAHFNYGTALYQAGRISESLSHFERAVQLRPDLAVAHYNLGYQLMITGQTEAALAQYEEALRLKPEYPEAHDNVGVVLAAMGRPDEAIAHYEEALRLKTDYAQAHDNFGNALLQMNRLPEAADQYAEAVRLEPGSARAQANLGNVLLQLDRTPEALAHLEEAVRLDPELAEARAKLGDALMETRRPDEAIGQYEEALRLNPGSVETQNNLGIALAATGRLPDAVGHYEEALRLDPDLADAHYNLANTLFRLGRVPEAAAQYEEVLRLKPGDPGARARLEMARKAMAGGARP